MYRLELSRLQDTAMTCGHHAVYVTAGSVDIDDQTLTAGEAMYIDATAGLPSISGHDLQGLCFSLLPDSNGQNTPTAILTQAVVLPDAEALMRLDKVSFPLEAVAFRHTHPGPGIRYLLHGELNLQADDHSHTAKALQAWFEAANSPVRATASATEETAFIRCMILPVAFEGKPTITVLSEEDRKKPARQSNHRFIDQRLDIPFKS